MNSTQHNSTSRCGDLALKADKVDLAEPPRTSDCCGTEATIVSSRSCGSNVGPTPSVAGAERETAVTIAPATAEDLGGVLSLLESLRLPTAGVADHFGDFLVAREKNGCVAGAIGLEYYGKLGLLRSAAVVPRLQKSGVGTKLTTLLIGFARGGGLTELVLFTPSGRDFFARSDSFPPTERITARNSRLQHSGPTVPADPRSSCVWRYGHNSDLLRSNRDDSRYAGTAGEGAPLGTSLALLSLPEMILLRRALHSALRIPGTFVGVVSIGILSIGYLFNLVL